MCKTGAPRRKEVTPRSFFASWVKRYIAGDEWEGRKEGEQKKEEGQLARRAKHSGWQGK